MLRLRVESTILLAVVFLLGSTALPGQVAAQGSDPNPGMIITDENGEALPLNDEGNVEFSEDTPGGFGEHSTAYVGGSAAVADPQWDVVGPGGEAETIGTGSTNVESRFLDPGIYVISNAGAVRVGDTPAGSTTVVAGAQVGVDVHDKTSPTMFIRVTPEDTKQENVCVVKEQPFDVYPPEDKTFQISVGGANFNAAIQEARYEVEPVLRESLVPAGNVDSESGRVQNTYELDQDADPSLPEGRLYFPANVRCQLDVEFRDNDPAEAVPGDPNSARRPLVEWYEVHRFATPTSEPEILREPPTYIFRSPTDEVSGPVYSLLAYAEDRTGNVTMVRLPITVFKLDVDVRELEYKSRRSD